MDVSKPLLSDDDDDQKLRVASDGDPFRGLSVRFMNGRLLELLNLTMESKECVYHVEPQIRKLSASPLVCPRDGRPGCALVDVAPDSFAGRANVMISYGWRYPVIVIATALAAYCCRHNLDPRSVIVWVCFACINQHRVKESRQKGVCIPFKEFEQIFSERVKGIGKVLCLLAPWKNPLYLQRVWCVFELYTAITNPDVEIEVILPPAEAHDFQHTLEANGADGLWNSLSSLKVEDAKASREEDRHNIMNLIITGPGAEYVNKNVRAKLRSWFADMAVREIKLKIQNISTNKSDAAAIVSIAVVAVRYWQEVGAGMPDVKDLANDVFNFCNSTLGPDSLESALAAETVAWVAMLASDFDTAIAMYKRQLEIKEKSSGKETKEYGVTMFWLGWALSSKGEFQEAVHVLRNTATILANVVGKTDMMYGKSLSAMAATLIELGEFDSAFDLYGEAIPILESAVGHDHPNTCILKKHQSRVFIARGDALRAISQLEEILEMEESTIGADSGNYAITLLVLAEALAAIGKLGRALYICDECLPIFEKAFGRVTKFGLWALRSRGRILRQMGLFDRARADLEEALSVAEAIAGKNTGRYKYVHAELTELLAENMDSKNRPRFQTDVDQWGDGDFDTSMWTEGDLETSMLSKFRELDTNHTGLIEFGEVMKLMKTLLKCDLDDHEIRALADAAEVSNDSSGHRRLDFRQFKKLGHFQANSGRLPEVWGH